MVSQDGSRSTPAFGALRRRWSSVHWALVRKCSQRVGYVGLGVSGQAEEERPWLQIRDKGGCWQSQDSERAQWAKGLEDWLTVKGFEHQEHHQSQSHRTYFFPPVTFTTGPPVKSPIML